MSPATAAQAPAESSTLQCAASVPMFRVSPTGGNMYLYHHLEPENGTNSWSPTMPKIGGPGWDLGRPVAAPDGVVYLAFNDGNLRRYRWNGTSWDVFDGAWFKTIATGGWNRYLTAEYRDRITVDTEGHIYTVEPDGDLHWRSHNAATGQMQHRVIGTGWSDYNLIAAAGRGIIFARSTAGLLYRFRYHADSDRWIQHAKHVGTGWQVYDQVFSGGGEVVYGMRRDIAPNGALYWYRYDENTQAWISNIPRSLGPGWLDLTTTAYPDACQRVGTSVPARPTVPVEPHPPVTLLLSTNEHLHLSYIDPTGLGVYGEIASLDGPNGLAGIPGFTGVAGTTSTGENADGRIQILANGSDSEHRASIQDQAGGIWTGTIDYGGYLSTTATTARLTNNTLVACAQDGTGALWCRNQLNINRAFSAWRAVTDPTPATLSLTRLTLVPEGDDARVFALGADGKYRTAVYDIQTNTMSAWQNLGGTTTFAGTVSAVTLADGKRQLFATDTTGTVRTQRETDTGFPGTWTALPTIIAAGSPSATMGHDGAIKLVTRTADNKIHFSVQQAPGSDTFTPWALVSNDPTTSDPTVQAMPAENTWVVSWIDDANTPRLVRAAPPAARTTSAFVEVPLTLEP
ncbi:tachylectin-related carbohydrate-binding protein [Actinophytocola sediminis]